MFAIQQQSKISQILLKINQRKENRNGKNLFKEQICKKSEELNVEPLSNSHYWQIAANLRNNTDTK